jgi:hypothetical protein
MPTILETASDPRLFASWFARGDWQAWRAFLSAVFALPLTDDELQIYSEATGRASPPVDPVREAWLVVGRRGGKSFILALIAVYLAAFKDYRQYLSPGERATVMVIAADRRQARIILRYVRALLSVPMLAQKVERESAEAFDLSNHTTIEIHTASFRSTRGYAIAAALCDEIAFWSAENSTEPDIEILNALRPGMATIPGAMLLCASSPYARRGALWESYRRHYGTDGDPILVWQSPTRTMNPSIPEAVVRDAMEADSASAQSEYMAEFRTDIEGFVSREVVEACTDVGVRERPPCPGPRYVAFTDPSGGSADSFTLAIAHRDANSMFLDCVREVRPPFSPESVVSEFAGLLKSYRVSRVTGDKYAGEWPREQFRKYGVTYELAPKSKSDLYRELLPLLNSRRISLLDNARLLAQLVGLERRTARSGRDSIDHAAGAHDDVANAAAGALVMAQAAERRRIRCFTLAPPVLPLGQPLPPQFEIHPDGSLTPVGEGEWHSALSPGWRNQCKPGKGIT